jgi:type II secretory pathway pseudopilin PulG
VKAQAGFVLVAALVAIVIIALLITGALFASGQDLAISRNEIRDQQALGAALNEIASGIGDARLGKPHARVVARSRMSSAGGSGLRRSVGIVVQTMRDGAPVNPPLRVSEQAWTALY